MANHFNDLLLQTLKQINVRLDRLDGRIEQKADKSDVEAINKKLDDVIETKADKTGLEATNTKLDSLAEKLDTKADKSDLDVTNTKLDSLGEKFDGLAYRIERIEAGIGTLRWVVGVEVAVIGVVLAFIKAC